MMKVAGGSVRLRTKCSLDEFIRQSDNYQALDTGGLNQVYNFYFITVVKVRCLAILSRWSVCAAEWAVSEEYRQIRQGNYQQSPASAERLC